MSQPTPHRALPTAIHATSPALGVPEGTLSAWGYSLQGVGHGVNQDAFGHTPRGFLGVADGVGGGAHGEIASDMLIQALAALQPTSAAEIDHALRELDPQIDARIQSHGHGAGAAVAVAMWPMLHSPRQWLTMTVGDCQILQFRRNASGWQQVWQSRAQTYANCGLQPASGIPATAPVNMIGCGMSMPAQVQTIDMHEGDRVILCSDGFYNVLFGSRLQALLNDAPTPPTSATLQAWCELARSLGSQDDITIVLAQTNRPHTYLHWLAFAVPVLMLLYILMA